MAGDTLIELAEELRRLANGLTRDLRRQAVLPGLSHLAAMRPVQDMLTRNLARMALDRDDEVSAGDDGDRHPGYL